MFVYDHCTHTSVVGIELSVVQDPVWVTHELLHQVSLLSGNHLRYVSCHIASNDFSTKLLFKVNAILIKLHPYLGLVVHPVPGLDDLLEALTEVGHKSVSLEYDRITYILM